MAAWERTLTPAQRDFLAHPLRRRIADLLAKQPGLNVSQVARALCIHLNLARFHLRRMAEVGLVELHESARRREVLCFLARDAHLWEGPATRLLFGGSAVRAVARHVAGNPGATTREVATATGLSFGAAHHHLKTLLERGLVTRFRMGPEYRHYPHAELVRWAASVPS